MQKQVWVTLALLRLLVGTTLQASDKEVLMKFSGQEWAGSISLQEPMGLTTTGNFNRVTIPDGREGIFVTWQSCVVAPPPPPPPCPPCDPPPPPPPPVCFSQVAGSAPIGGNRAARRRGSDAGL